MTSVAPIKYEDLIKNMGLPSINQAKHNIKNTHSEHKKMPSAQKKKMIQDIDKLDAKDHISILKIIKNHTQKKIYTLNNYGCYIDLNDLSNKCLHELRYYLDLCLDNQKRKKEKDKIYQEHLEHKQQHEEQFKSNKFKLGRKIKPISVAGGNEEQDKEGCDDISSDSGTETEEDMMENLTSDLELNLNIEDTTISGSIDSIL